MKEIKRLAILAPHPDDECIWGAPALYFARAGKCRVEALALTLGSNPQRQAARWREMQAACRVLGFHAHRLTPTGLAPLSLRERNTNPRAWNVKVARLAAWLKKMQPDALVFSHAQDVHPTHEASHWLVQDALQKLPATFQALLIESEFWQPMRHPNWLLAVDEKDLRLLVRALSRHKGEVARNAYHERLPAWMVDNVRRGAELLRGMGSGAPPMWYGVLLRARLWENKCAQPMVVEGR